MRALALAFVFLVGAAHGAPVTQGKKDLDPSAPPKLVSREPAHLDPEVDPKQVTRMVLIFDRPMNDKGWSFCGGDKDVPPFKNKPSWDTPTKLVVDVVLEPDRDYRFSLNCPSATNFRSLKDVALEPVPWSFSTLPAKLPNPTVQRKENKESLAELMTLLGNRYSHYDLRVRSWSKLEGEHDNAIIGMRTTRGWTNAVANMLAATEDIHLSLKLGDSVYATGKRAVDPLYRPKLISKYIGARTVGDGALVGRSEDDIGYAMIPSWSSIKDVDALERALEGMRDCKAFILDVRPNSGGDELLAQRIAAWFVEGTPVYAKHCYRMKPGKDGFGPILQRSLTGNAAGRRLDVPVAVLTSRYVMSSNESFVLMMRQAPDCTVVGQRTFGSSGNPKPHELPNGVTVLIPTWRDLRPDGTCFEGEGIAPDVEVECEGRDFAEGDPILERALVVVREKSAKK